MLPRLWRVWAGSTLHRERGEPLSTRPSPPCLHPPTRSNSRTPPVYPRAHLYPHLVSTTSSVIVMLTEVRWLRIVTLPGLIARAIR